MNAAPGEYQFTNDWFDSNIPTWKALLPRFNPKKVLEIGSYEGKASCFLIETFTADHPLEIHCIDTWEGGIEHDKGEMTSVEQRFDHNIGVALAKVKHPARVTKHKAQSMQALAELLARGNVNFDVIYVDGSHQAQDVLTDAVLSFYLLRVGGLMIFDDYLWSMESPGQQDPLNMPKPAVDAFLNTFQRKMVVVHAAPIYQLYAFKNAA